MSERIKAGAILLIFFFSLGLINQAVAYPPQQIFDIQIFMTITESGTASVKMTAKLIDPYLLSYLNNLQKNDPQKAQKEFHDMVFSLIFLNLQEFIQSQTNKTVIITPQTGFIELHPNWTTTLNFKIYNYLTLKNGTLKSAVYGPMRFIFKNKVLSYHWKRLTIIFPKNAYIINLAPVPKEMTENVAVWENGDYLPIIALTFNETVFQKERAKKTKIIPFKEFLDNSTKVINLRYDPFAGTVTFNGSITGMKPEQYHIAKLIDEFNMSMDLIKFDIKSTENGVTFSGEAKPMLQYKETLTKKVWNITIRLPFRFDKVNIKAPKDQGVQMIYGKTDNTIVNMVFEEKKICGPGVIVGLTLFPLLLRKRRR
ncbi:CGP-CTERM sorting domain-containing protein [Thermococcus sp. SY098]|uniref:CGP-CTERM sorting domain-containing protein n=1 Tax=Thermococcus sp. SY098 TaxID=3111325 RepID=UPI002D7A077C|nr:CGP-CTERM sorting domain-containing protein [Thermococcus sp. SY098]WRS51883.1 CGP-CTERM sorting domain-containing protein [Thermococcus sp. SY098]